MKKNLILLLFVILFIVVCFVFSLYSTKEKVNKEIIKEVNQKIELIEVNNQTTFTGYSLSVEETDGSPCIGAGNNNLCELKKEMRICASRDLPLDTLIYIDGFGECVIKDRMNKRYKGTGRIDILFNSKQEAIKFGIKEIKYAIIK